MNKIIHLLTKNLTIIFFALFLMLGFISFDDYGVSWDEQVQRKLVGELTYQYILGSVEELDGFHKYYGSVFEVFLVFVEKQLNLVDSREIYLLRHFLTFFSFYIGVIFFYLLCNKIFRNTKLALLASIMLVLSPRIFAHSFYNSKDIPFLSMFIIGVHAQLNMFEKRTIKSILVYTFIAGIVIDIRITGIFLILLTVIHGVLNYKLSLKGKASSNNSAVMALVFVVSLAGFIVLFRPFLWDNTIYGFINIFKFMSHFAYNLDVLYFGNYINASNLPWHYIFIWIIISTPLLYLGLFAVGLVTFLKKIYNNRYNNNDLEKFIIVVAWFFVPLVIVLALNSVIYDGWRHLFFIYPALIIIAVYGLSSVCLYAHSINSLYVKLLFWAVFINLIFIGRNMINLHPFENVYFNSIRYIFNDDLKYYFDMDYWGLSYRRALEGILFNDASRLVSVYVLNSPGILNAKILPINQRRRVKFVNNIVEADYFINDYRYHKVEFTPGRLFFTIKKNGNTVIDIFKLK